MSPEPKGRDRPRASDALLNWGKNEADGAVTEDGAGKDGTDVEQQTTELLRLIAAGTPLPEIAKAAYRSVVKRILEMDPLTGQVVMTGGVVAHNPIIVDLVSDTLGREVLVPDHPQYTGALGAALIAGEARSASRPA